MSRFAARESINQSYLCSHVAWLLNYCLGYVSLMNLLITWHLSKAVSLFHTTMSILILLSYLSKNFVSSHFLYLLNIYLSIYLLKYFRIF